MFISVSPQFAWLIFGLLGLWSIPSDGSADFLGIIIPGLSLAVLTFALYLGVSAHGGKALALLSLPGALWIYLAYHLPFAQMGWHSVVVALGVAVCNALARRGTGLEMIGQAPLVLAPAALVWFHHGITPIGSLSLALVIFLAPTVLNSRRRVAQKPALPRSPGLVG